MGKLLKYEFRNSRKKVFQQIGIILLVSLLLQAIISGVFRYAMSNLHTSGPLGFIATISGLIVFAGIILIIVTGFLYYITLANILKKDIYYGQGYITFSIPKSGYQIIGAKILVSLFWLMILPIITIAFNTLLAYIVWVLIPGVVNVNDFWNQVSGFITSPKFYEFLREISIKDIIYISFVWIISGIFTILLMYSSVIIDYRIGRRKQDSSMWILYYIILSIIYGFVLSMIFSPISFTNSYTSSTISLDSTINPNLYWMRYINLGINFVSSILLYIFVSHNFENKIEK
ncbi:hypothetical protein P5008_07755 [Helcococcus ovis]|uniref:hypothetical protein n=1 Tax=Helcococcus ovis TaxID=72026 RepID=UPI0039175943